MKKIYFAGGCFWGTEMIFKAVPGVSNTVVGYANGITENPSYSEVCKDNTGHRETVLVEYDENMVSLELLTEVFFMIIDPSQKNRQGGDIGSQYQTGVYFCDDVDRKILEEVFTKKRQGADEFYVELEKLMSFWNAEEYHQDYLDKNPNGYCHISLQQKKAVIEYLKGIYKNMQI
ncbi:MAG: peptide-methionine (S)-S-oxide reductase MsrA [Eubacterium sp.]|nr:peptide-methionine (S)-S-oxide reductase MsrA [Eubacterium sp.]